MIKLNDITNNRISINFGDLEIGDYFIQNPLVIWMKTARFNIYGINESGANAIQITDNDNYLRYGLFKNDSIVEKIEITSIDYRRIK